MPARPDPGGQHTHEKAGEQEAAEEEQVQRSSRGQAEENDASRRGLRQEYSRGPDDDEGGRECACPDDCAAERIDQRGERDGDES